MSIVGQSLADELALTSFKVWYVTEDYSLRANVRAPNSFAARNALITLAQELEPNRENLPTEIFQLSYKIGHDTRWATLECCLQCKGAGEMMRNFNREGNKIHLRQCLNCGGVGGFLTVDDASKGILDNV